MSERAVFLAVALVVRGATIHTAAGPPIADGVLVVERGKVAVAGGPATVVPPGAEVVDGRGKHVSPPFFAPASLLGLVEIPAVRATVDAGEGGDVNSDVRPEVAMNLDSELLPVARSGGVLYAALVPRGSLLPGAVAVVRLEGFTREDACVACPAALAVEWPRMLLDRSPDARPKLKAQIKRRDDALETLRRTFSDAAAWLRSRDAAGSGGLPPPENPAMAAIAPVLEGKLPLLVRAGGKLEIEAALRWIEEQLEREPNHPTPRVVLLGANDGPRLPAKLAERKVSVILDGVLTLPDRRDEPYDAPFARAGLLSKAGVLVAIGNGSGPFHAAHVRDLPLHAAVAAGFGLERVEALRSVTLNPARIYGVDDRIGSLEPGKEGSFVLWSGEPLDPRSRVERLWDRGRELDLSDRQKRLFEKYDRRPRRSE